jgi:hypothetical protein
MERILELIVRSYGQEYATRASHWALSITKGLPDWYYQPIGYVAPSLVWLQSTLACPFLSVSFHRECSDHAFLRAVLQTMRAVCELLPVAVASLQQLFAKRSHMRSRPEDCFPECQSHYKYNAQKCLVLVSAGTQVGR